MNFVVLRLNVRDLDDLEESVFDVPPEHSPGYLPEELLQHAGYGVHTEIVHVDQPTGL